MRIIIITLFLCMSISCSSQNEVNNKEYIPILTGGKNDKIEIFDSNVNDSLRVVYKIVINLEHPLKDTAKVINIQSFDLISMSVINLITKESVIDNSYDNNIGTDYQKYIWNLCYNKLKYWYMKQNYRDMIDRSQWDKRVVLGGTFYIEPSFSHSM